MVSLDRSNRRSSSATTSANGQSLRETSIDAFDAALDLIFTGSIHHLGMAGGLAAFQKRAGKFQLLLVRQPQSLLSDLGQFATRDMIESTIETLSSRGVSTADTVIQFDPWWNAAVEAQATDRAHRIGQTRVVTAYKLITRDTVEEKILKLQEKNAPPSTPPSTAKNP